LSRSLLTTCSRASFPPLTLETTVTPLDVGRSVLNIPPFLAQLTLFPCHSRGGPAHDDLTPSCRICILFLASFPSSLRILPHPSKSFDRQSSRLNAGDLPIPLLPWSTIPSSRCMPMYPTDRHPPLAFSSQVISHRLRLNNIVRISPRKGHAAFQVLLFDPLLFLSIGGPFPPS